MHSLLRVGLMISIAVVFPLMVGLGIEAFYPGPDSPWEQCREREPVAPAGPDRTPRDPMSDAGYRQCLEEAERPVQSHNRNLFLITTLIGFGAIAAGALMFGEGMGPIGPGLVFGGLITILYGSGRTLGTVDKRWLFLELLAVFIGLIVVTRRYLQVGREAPPPA